MVCAPTEDSDQPGHPPSLIRVFAVRMKKAWVLSYPLSAQRRLWSDWADVQADPSPRWAHRSVCWFCHKAAQLFITVAVLINYVTFRTVWSWSIVRCNFLLSIFNVVDGCCKDFCNLIWHITWNMRSCRFEHSESNIPTTQLNLSYMTIH